MFAYSGYQQYRLECPVWLRIISLENRSLPDLMMGVETSIPPFAMDAAAPKGAPRRPQLPDFLETVLAPPCPARGPEARNAHINAKYFTDFHGSGVNRMGSCPFLQSRYNATRIKAEGPELQQRYCFCSPLPVGGTIRISLQFHQFRTVLVMLE